MVIGDLMLTYLSSTVNFIARVTLAVHGIGDSFRALRPVTSPDRPPLVSDRRELCGKR